jgi:hypothetical protein
MSKTDMSYYKNLLAGMAGATLGSAAAKTLPPIKGLSGNLLGAAKGAKGLKKKIIKKKKGGKVK